MEPRALSRLDAAARFAISPSLFDRMVREGIMPAPKRLGGRKVWDVRALDDAFDARPGGTGKVTGGNPWDVVLG
jgi:predicted DNA-binding transcriptional regulator AlpA